MNQDVLIRFHNDLVQFDSATPIVVQYNETNGLIYRQLNRLCAIPYMSNFFFHNPSFKLGILMPNQFTGMMKDLEMLIQDPQLRQGQLSQTMGTWEFKFYKQYSGLVGPQLTYDIKLVTFTNPIIVKWLLTHSGLETLTLYKAIKNENRKCKSRK